MSGSRASHSAQISPPKDFRRLIRTAPVLQKRHRILAFDWDGTAVRSRRDPAGPLAARAEALAAEGVWLVVITGTNFDNIDRQYFRLLSAQAKQRHWACVNRGSEVFGFNERGNSVVLHRRVATDEENRLMDRVAVAIRQELKASFSLETAIVFDRFNRRKLDLIPVPEWSDPPKERIGELLTAVKRRLRQAHVPGGIRQIMDRVEELARRNGIELRLTTDVKHVEFGLTDKSDSIEYLSNALAEPMGVRPAEILIVGDEFGPINGFEGSDFRTFVLPGAVYVSVGKEPNGVPEGVLHLGGGVPAFLAMLDRQIELRAGGRP